MCLLCALCMPTYASSKNCDSKRSTAATITCLKAQVQKHQENLNTAFSDALSGSEEGHQDQIKQSQSAWLSYRDLQCEFHAEAEDHESLKRLENLRCMSNLTRERIQILSGLDVKQDSGSQFGNIPRWMSVLAQDKPNAYWDYDSRIEFNWACEVFQNEEDMYYAMIGFEPSDEGANHVVLGISDSPKTGKPNVKIYDIAVQSCDDETRATDEEPYLCSTNLQFMMRIGENREGCRHALVLDDKKDIRVTVSKAEKDFVVSVTDSRPDLVAADTPDEQ